MTRPRAARGEGDQLREQLIEATAALLAETGDERAVTIRAIVDAVGVTPPSLYLHFPTKRDLVREVVDRRFAALGQAIGQAVAEPAGRGAAVEALRAGCLAYLRWAHDDPGGYQVLFGARRETRSVGPDGSSDTAAFTSLKEGIGFCQATGVGREGDITRMATLLWASLHGLATLVPTRPEFGWPPLETMVDELIAGLVGAGR